MATTDTLNTQSVQDTICTTQETSQMPIKDTNTRDTIIGSGIAGALIIALILKGWYQARRGVGFRSPRYKDNQR